MATKMSDIGTFIIQKVKYYPVTLLFVIITWYLSFFTPPKTELDEVAFIDKWVHVAMYGGTFGTLWIEYLRHHGGVLSKRTLSGIADGTRMRVFVWAWLMPIIMSGCIELLQEYCTGGRRSGDWIDLAANAMGVTLAAIFGLILSSWNCNNACRQ